MIATLVISISTFVLITLSIILFPSIKIGKVKIDTYWIIALLGAIILLSFNLAPIKEVYNQLTSDLSINPLKILVLFFSMTILSIYLDEIGLFKYLAIKATKKAKNNQITLFVIFYLLTSILTIFTSNDIVILTLTPFICFFAKHAKISPLPYLIAEFAAANTWSMMFIIGNPTNIYLATTANIDFISYLKVMFLPTLFAGLVEFLLVFLLFSKKLRTKMEVSNEDYEIESKLDLIIGVSSLVICLIFLIISSYINLEMWLIAVSCAGALLLAALIIRLSTRKHWNYLGDSFKRLPYPLIPFMLSMFVIVVAINYQGISEKIANVLNQGHPIWVYGYSSLLASNLINNIPMSILFSNLPNGLPELDALKVIYSSIIGSNIGAFLTPIGALAGIMFTSLLSKYEVKFSFLDFVKYGVIIAIPTASIALLGLFIVL